MTRVLVCGGRQYGDYDTLPRVLCDVHELHTITTLIHGGSSGADAMAAHWAKGRPIEVVCFPADWKKHGRRAGPLRNQQMLDDGKPDLVVAFPGGRGTRNMVELAKAAGVEVLKVRE